MLEDLDKALMTLTMNLSQVARAYKSAADKMAGDYELSQASAWPVVMIHRLGDGVRPGAVANALGLDPSSLVRLVDQLVDAGLVTRGEDSSDRRARILHLTAGGRQRAEQLEQALRGFRRALFQDISATEVDSCLRVLSKFSARIAEFEQQAGREQDA